MAFLDFSSVFSYDFVSNRPDSTSGKTFTSGAEGMRFKCRADQISEMGTAHS